MFRRITAHRSEIVTVLLYLNEFKSERSGNQNLKLISISLTTSLEPNNVTTYAQLGSKEVAVVVSCFALIGARQHYMASAT